MPSRDYRLISPCIFYQKAALEGRGLYPIILGHCWVYPACQIQELTLAEPRLARLKGEKKVVYAQDLPPHLRLRLPKQPSLLAE
jgi:hypothetical protein